MKIHKNLLKASDPVFSPSKQTRPMSIMEICQKIESNTLTLPVFQRDLTWTINQAVDLFNYQALGASPMAPISINEITSKNYVDQISFFDRDTILDVSSRNHYSIVDGLQRTSTNHKAFINHEDFNRIILDLKKGIFRTVKVINTSIHIPIGILYNKDPLVLSNYLNSIESLNNDKLKNILLGIRTKFLHYSYTVNLAEDLTEDEQIKWFEVLNNAGSKVTKVQMKFSKLKIKEIDIYKNYTRIFVLKLSQRKYDKLFHLKPTEVSIPICALNPAYEKITNKIHSQNFTPIPSDIRIDQIALLNAGTIQHCFDIALKALDDALEFIKINNLPDPNRIDQITYLLGYFIFKDFNAIDQITINQLIQWYNKVDFTNKTNTERRNIFSGLLDI